MKQKLNAKDFILIGVLTALMWIICMVISTIMSVAGPVTNVFYPSVVAIPNGIVMMLLLAKVPKKGVFTICAAIQDVYKRQRQLPCGKEAQAERRPGSQLWRVCRDFKAA